MAQGGSWGISCILFLDLGIGFRVMCVLREMIKVYIYYVLGDFVLYIAFFLMY